MRSTTELRCYDPRETLPAEVAAFLEEHATSIFLTSDWFTHFCRTGIEPSVIPYLLSVKEGGRTRCVIPLLRTRLRRGGVSMPMLTSLTNYYALDFAPVCEPGAEGLAANALSIERPAILRFDSMEDEAADRMEAILRAAGHRPQRFDSFVNWVEEPGGMAFDDWFSKRPSQLRNTWRRRLKKLGSLGGARIEFHGWKSLARTEAGEGSGIPIELAESVDALIGSWNEVYTRSWKQPEPFPDFVPGLIRLAAQRGWLRLGALFVADRPVATQLWLHHRGRTIIYKLAYDEEFRELSPGLALSVEMFRNAIAVDRASIIDYGSGDDTYKKDWMSTRRVRLGLDAFNLRHPLGLVGYAVNKIREHLPA